MWRPARHGQGLAQGREGSLDTLSARLGAMEVLLGEISLHHHSLGLSQVPGLWWGRSPEAEAGLLVWRPL